MPADQLLPLVAHGPGLGDEVYRVIGQAILSGALPPGERLRDHDLAGRLGVSRTPVREALQRLERVGMVEVSPHRYTRVTTPTSKAQTDTFEFVAYLMGSVVRIACARCPDDVMERAGSDADAMVAASAADDSTALGQASYRLFADLTRASGNVAIGRFMREAEIAIRRHLPAWRPFVESTAERTELYRRFRDGLAARDGDAAEEALREIHGLA